MNLKSLRVIAVASIATPMLFASTIAVAQRSTTAAPTEDCRPYNPTALRIQESPLEWMIWAPLTTARGGNLPLAGVASKQDLANAQALVERYAEICYIGRRTTGRTRREN